MQLGLALTSLLLTPSRSIRIAGIKKATRDDECQEAQRITDFGHDDAFKGWYDVRGCGQCYDYCRWVGPGGSGGDPAVRRANGQGWWSCALSGSDDEHDGTWGASVYDTWNYSRCAGQGAVPPPAATPYVRGQPGGSWTVEEMLVVRAKLHRVMNEGLTVVREVEGDYDQEIINELLNPAATMLRLGFHDCLKYADSENGIGGCDGCLDMTGVGHRYEDEDLLRGRLPSSAPSDGGNNGLGYLVRVLESIYTDPSKPVRTPNLGISLQQRGKSRADLWAFAALVAVDFTLDLNNRACETPDHVQEWPWGQCHPRLGEEDCMVQAPRDLEFKTGRRDCTVLLDERGYATSRQEVHPDPETNGDGTVTFFRENFDFNGRETVAIMGAHTLGKLHVHQSLFRYTWKTQSGMLLNNGYFRNMVKKPDWYYPSEPNRTQCKRVGDYQGRRPEARYLAHIRGDTETFGPVQWIQEKYICHPYDIYSSEVDTCPEVNQSWRFTIGIDESMLNAEMGLYLKFNVTEYGIPYGCPGFQYFNAENWVGFDENHEIIGWDHKWTEIDGDRSEPGCLPQDIRNAADDKTLHEIVDEYAESTTAWLEDFQPALEKVLANGYGDDDLQPAPAAGMSRTGISCSFPTNPQVHAMNFQYTCMQIEGA